MDAERYHGYREKSHDEYSVRNQSYLGLKAYSGGRSYRRPPGLGGRPAGSDGQRKGDSAKKNQSPCAVVDPPGILRNRRSTTKRVYAHSFLAVSMRDCYNIVPQIPRLLIEPLWN